MKKLLIALALTISSATYAATDTRAIRTSTDLVSLGDSSNSMMNKLGRPSSSYEYVTRDANNKIITATDFYYTIDNLKYTITIHHGNIVKIIWER